MAMKLTNQGKPWTPAHEKLLRSLAKGNTPTRVIGIKMGRTEGSIRSKAQNLNVPLTPWNQTPYNRNKGK